MTSKFPQGRMSPDRARRYRSEGLHSDVVLNQLPIRAEQIRPDAEALRFENQSLSWRAVNALISQVASHLRRCGVERGSVVVLQAPNSPGTVISMLAAWHIGAVLLPVVDIYREREISQLLEQVVPAAVITVESHRSHHHAQMFDDLLQTRGIEVPARLLVTGRRPGWTTLADLPTPGSRVTPEQMSPDEPALVLLTSGSTGRAKGAVHSSRSLLAEGGQVGQAWDWTSADVSYVPVPLSHISGLLRGVLLPTMNASTVVLRAGWDTEAAVRDLTQTRASYSTVPGLLLGEFIEAYERLGCPPHDLKLISVGVSDGAYAAVEAAERHGMTPTRAYGLSELPTVSIATRIHGLHERIYTCGPPAPGVELQVRDEYGTALPDGESGEIVVRGPEQMLGYLDPSDDLEAWTEDGWLRTGDVGRIDAGSVRLVGRIKDIINRGGEKLAAVEIEDCLRQHPGVRTVAVVPGPDPRLGEVPVAFVVRADSASALSTDDLVSHMAASGLARQKIPRDWRFVADLPMTASGKVQKGRLAAELAEGQGATDR